MFILKLLNLINHNFLLGIGGETGWGMILEETAKVI
jgi:hypothetical protein